MSSRDRSAYLHFSRDAWQQFRQDTPLTLSDEDLSNLHGQLQTVSMDEVRTIYLSLSRLLSFYVTARQELYKATSAFLGQPWPKVPYIIGIAGSVAVGKSTASRVLQALLSRWPNHPHVSVLTTDSFIYPLAELEARGILHRKGFPESYDVGALVSVLQQVKSGQPLVTAPVYSHHLYDVVPGEVQEIEQPDILIVEGLNILQTGAVKPLPPPEVFVSDFFDFTIFVDAELDAIRSWYVERVEYFYQTVFKKPDSYFHYLTELKPEELTKFAERVWREINEVNLTENILPYKNRAHLILEKAPDHTIECVRLRKC